MEKHALLSDCQSYRYNLLRIWDAGKPRVMFIGLNPSTADQQNDDPTLVRCMGFARDWGYGGVCMANLFAWRCTDPKELFMARDPVGPNNDHWLEELAKSADLIIAAWGNQGSMLGRADRVRSRLSGLNYLKMNRSGQPAHPLYLRRDLTPIELV